MKGLIYADLKIKRKWMVGVILISWAIVIIVRLLESDPQDPIDALSNFVVLYSILLWNFALKRIKKIQKLDFLRSLPLGDKDIVYGTYLYNISTNLVMVGVMFVSHKILAIIVGETLYTSVIVVLIFILLIWDAIVLPGYWIESKALQWITLIGWFGICFAPGYLSQLLGSDYLEQIIDFLQGLDGSMILVGVLILGIGLYYLSMRLSLKIYRKAMARI